MPTPTARKSVAVPTGKCPMCSGTGVELFIDGYGRLCSQGCLWCLGSGAAEELPQPCPCCGKPAPVVAGERVCADCTRWEPNDPRYDDLDAVLANLPELP